MHNEMCSPFPASTNTFNNTVQDSLNNQTALAKGYSDLPADQTAYDFIKILENFFSKKHLRNLNPNKMKLASHGTKQ